MVWHQTVRPYLDSCSTSLLGEQIAINVVVPVLEKYRLPPVPALGHVMRKAGNHHAGKARHLGKLPRWKEKGIGIMSTHLMERRDRQRYCLYIQTGACFPI